MSTSEAIEAIGLISEASLEMASNLAVKSVIELSPEKRAEFMQRYAEMASFHIAFRRYADGLITEDELGAEAEMNALDHYQAINPSVIA